MFVVAVLLVPPAEEYFFRGWLQPAIAVELTEARRAWVIPLSAAAFALAHLGTYGMPQFVLGLLTGVLFSYTGSIWPGTIAHAAHNAVLIWLHGQS